MKGPLLLLLLQVLLPAVSQPLTEYILHNGDPCFQLTAAVDTNRCYSLVPGSSRSWTAAVSACRGADREPVVVGDSETHTALVAVMRNQQLEHVWLPATLDRNSWYWAGTSEIVLGEYSAWRSGHPVTPERSDLKDCVMAITYLGFPWEDKECAFDTGFICQAEVGTKLCDDGRTLFDEVVYVDNICLLVSNQRLSFFKSRDRCAQLGAQLLRVEDAATQSALRHVTSWNATFTYGYWIGLTRTRWLWENGDEVSLSFWEASQPSMSNADCAVLKKFSELNYFWANWNCEARLPYICVADIPVETTTQNISSILTSPTIPSTTSISSSTTSPTTIISTNATTPPSTTISSSTIALTSTTTATTASSTATTPFTTTAATTTAATKSPSTTTPPTTTVAPTTTTSTTTSSTTTIASSTTPSSTTPQSSSTIPPSSTTTSSTTLSSTTTIENPTPTSTLTPADLITKITLNGGLAVSSGAPTTPSTTLPTSTVVSSPSPDPSLEVSSSLKTLKNLTSTSSTMASIPSSMPPTDSTIDKAVVALSSTLPTSSKATSTTVTPTVTSQTETTLLSTTSFIPPLVITSKTSAAASSTLTTTTSSTASIVTLPAKTSTMTTKPTTATTTTTTTTTSMSSPTTLYLATPSTRRAPPSPVPKSTIQYRTVTSSSTLSSTGSIIIKTIMPSQRLPSLHPTPPSVTSPATDAPAGNIVTPTERSPNEVGGTGEIKEDDNSTVLAVAISLSVLAIICIILCAIVVYHRWKTRDSSQHPARAPSSKSTGSLYRKRSSLTSSTKGGADYGGSERRQMSRPEAMPNILHPAYYEPDLEPPVDELVGEADTADIEAGIVAGEDENTFVLADDTLFTVYDDEIDDFTYIDQYGMDRQLGSAEFVFVGKGSDSLGRASVSTLSSFTGVKEKKSKRRAKLNVPLSNGAAPQISETARVEERTSATEADVSDSSGNIPTTPSPPSTRLVPDGNLPATLPPPSGNQGPGKASDNQAPGKASVNQAPCKASVNQAPGKASSNQGPGEGLRPLHPPPPPPSAPSSKPPSNEPNLRKKPSMKEDPPTLRSILKNGNKRTSGTETGRKKGWRRSANRDSRSSEKSDRSSRFSGVSWEDGGLVDERPVSEEVLASTYGLLIGNMDKYTHSWAVPYPGDNVPVTEL